MNLFEVTAAAPIIIITALSLIILFIEAFLKKSEKVAFVISLIGLTLCIPISLATADLTGTVFNKMINAGGTGSLFAALFSSAALLTIILSRGYLQKEHAGAGEFYLLIIFSTLGMMLMASAADLIVAFLGLELMSICLYVLAGFMRTREVSNESSLKYFLIGAFATGFLLYGIALIYGATGTTNIRYMVNNFSTYVSQSSLFLVGVGLLMVGIAFKVGAVPFHMWIPDVYQGSPTTISGFMSTAAKAAAFSVFLLVLGHPFEHAGRIKTIFAVISAMSMILGNIIAISQTNIKRMLAYSSIAHAGYMLAGLAAANQFGRSGIIFYLSVYTFMNIGAFGVISLLEKEEEQNLTFDDYAGLGTKRPFIAALMVIFMLSLAGIPPFAGFFGKYYVFLAAINADLTWLAIIGVLMSVVSVYYYLRLVMIMYFREGVSHFDDPLPKSSLVTVAFAACVVVAIGIFPSSLLSIINNFS